MVCEIRLTVKLLTRRLEDIQNTREGTGELRGDIQDGLIIFLISHYFYFCHSMNENHHFVVVKLFKIFISIFLSFEIIIHYFPHSLFSFSQSQPSLVERSSFSRVEVP